MQMFLEELSKNQISSRQFGLTALRKDGSSFLMDLSVVSVKINGQNCLLAIIRDISDWKAMEEELRRERDLLEGVTASTNIILSIVDRDYRIIWANQTAKQINPEVEIKGKYCHEIFAGGAQENCKGCGVKKVFEDGVEIARRDYFTKVKGKDMWAGTDQYPN